MMVLLPIVSILCYGGVMQTLLKLYQHRGNFGTQLYICECAEIMKDKTKPTNNLKLQIHSYLIRYYFRFLREKTFWLFI